MFFDDLDPKMMILTAVLFLILIWILNVILYKPMFSFMKSRDDGIKEDEAKIHQNNTDSENNETLVSKIYSDARAKAEAIRTEKVLQARQKHDEIVEEKKKALEQEYEQFLLELNKNKESFKDELRSKLSLNDDLLSNIINRV